MEFEFYWADYKRFGSDGSLMTLSRLMQESLKADYGKDIKKIFICGHCRALIPPNDNLSKAYKEFDEERKKLQDSPSIRFLKKKQELEIRFATVWPVAEELRPDDDMLKLGTFKRFYKKTISLLNASSNKLEKKTNFNFQKLIEDIQHLETELPKSLNDLALAYIKHQ